MEVRKVVLDFSDAEVHWSPGNPEYSQLLNAVSVGLPPIEQFLVKVVRRVREAVPEGDPLRDDADTFVGQEGRHARLHSQFNRELRRDYPEIAPHEQRFRDDLDRFLETRDLRFCLAYCEGFETVGPIVAAYFFERGKHYMRDWDEPTVFLWLWHFAEEYEHRTVCNYLFKEVYGSYWHRIHGLVYLLAHAPWRLSFVFRELMSADRREGRIVGPIRSRLRFARVLAGLVAYAAPRLVKAFKPTYDPGPIPAPARCVSLLAAASERYGVADGPRTLAG